MNFIKVFNNRQTFHLLCIRISTSLIKRGILLNVFVWAVIGIIVLVLWRSIVDFIKGKSSSAGIRLKDSAFSMELFYALLLLYSTIIIGFSLIYFVLSYQGIVLVEHSIVRDVSAMESLVHSIYFSGVTLLTIGYGDIVPIGVGRIVALVEALIGYLLPTAFVFRLFINRSSNNG